MYFCIGVLVYLWPMSDDFDLSENPILKYRSFEGRSKLESVPQCKNASN